MILPNTLMLALVALGAGALLWSLWIVTFRAANADPLPANRWRFEYYSFDFALGAIIASLTLALTLGSLGWDGFAFTDELVLSGKRQELWAFLAGLLFTLGNMLMLGSASLSGVLLSMPVTTGLAFGLGAILMNVVNPGGSWIFLIAGLFVTIAALVFGFMAFHGLWLARIIANIQSGKAKSTSKAVNPKGFVLAVFGGLFMSGFFPLMDMARVPDLGMGPYTATFMCCTGILISTIMFNMFFMNLPVQGKPASFGTYFTSAPGKHIYGVLGGMLWALGTVGHYMAARMEGDAAVSGMLRFAGFQAPIVLSALLGLVIWKEMDEAESKPKNMAGIMLLLLLVAAVLYAMSAPAPK